MSEGMMMLLLPAQGKFALFTVVLVAGVAWLAWLGEKRARVRRGLQGVLLLGLVAGAMAYMWYAMFSQFYAHDDEGFFLLTVRHMLDGYRLYDDVKLMYGPFYYACRWLVHGLCGVPLGTDTTRLESLVIWLATAMVSAGAIYRICRKSAAGAGVASIGLALTALHATAFAQDPGHPQELVALLTATALLAATFAKQERIGMIALLLGGCGGALLLTKINVGVFLLAAASVALVSLAPRGSKGWGWQALQGLVLLGAAALPVALMLPFLLGGVVCWTRFCVTAVVGFGLCAMTAMRKQEEWEVPVKGLLAFVAGAAGAGLLAIGFALMQGNSLGAMLFSLVLKAKGFSTGAEWYMNVPAATYVYVAMGAGLGLLYEFSKGKAREVLTRYVLPGCKLTLASLIILDKAGVTILPYSAWFESWPLHYLMGFIWLTLVPPAQRRPDMAEVVFRRVLAFVAVMMVLQMFPVASGHAYIGTLPLVVMAALWMGDALAALEFSLEEKWAGKLLRVSYPLLVALGAYLMVAQARQRHNYYISLQKVRLTGAHLMRMDESKATAYASVVDNVKASADAFVCTTGANSLYAWTGQRPATRLMLGNGWGRHEAFEKELAEKNDAVPRFVYLEHATYATSRPEPDMPFMRMVHARMRPWLWLGEFTLWVRAERTDLAARSCALLRLAEPPGERGGSAPGQVQLEVRWPAERPRLPVTRVCVVDLKRDTVLGDTAATDPNKRLEVYARDGKRLLPGPADSASIEPPGEDNAWTLRLSGQAHLEKSIHGYSFAAGDIKDAASFVAKLRQHADPVSQYVWEKLSSSTRQRLADDGPKAGQSQEAPTELLGDLNQIVQGIQIYDPQRFAQVRLSDETRGLIPHRENNEHRPRFNRLLLEEAYPLELARNPFFPAVRFYHLGQVLLTIPVAVEMPKSSGQL